MRELNSPVVDGDTPEAALSGSVESDKRSDVGGTITETELSDSGKSRSVSDLDGGLAQDGDLPEGASGGGGGRRTASHRPRHGRRTTRGRTSGRRRLVVFALLAVTLLLVGVDLAGGTYRRSDAELAASTGLAGSDKSPAPTGAATPIQTPAAAPTTPAPVTPGPVPSSGAGTFAVAPGGTAPAGRGTLLKYQIEVENGVGQDAAAFATAVDATLRDQRSWIAGGDQALARVSDNRPDFRIRLASPKTVDRLCYPLDTAGYTSCRVGDNVVINLARWQNAVPEFAGDLTTYRAYAINHEVGHRLGHGHESCTGTGQPAPVMQQQTLGLKGCKANPWPYVGGRLLSGPSTT